MSPMDDLNQYINELVSKDKVQEWKELAKPRIQAYVSNTKPFTLKKLSKFFFYIDSDTFIDSLVIQGVKPNAGFAKGFTAKKRVLKPLAEPRPFQNDKGKWFTAKYRLAGYSSIGVEPLDTKYYVVSGSIREYFGLKRKGGYKAYGLIDDAVVPIYSEQGIVDWLMETQSTELYSILNECAIEALND